MEEIGSIYLGSMNNGGHFLYVNLILERAEADPKVSEKAAVQVAVMKTAVSKEDEALKISPKSLISDDIALADRERDILFGKYKKAVASFLDFPVENMAQAAKVLNQHLIDYNIDPQMQLDRETGMLLNFISDLEGKYAAQVAALSLTLFVTHLKAANEKVITLTKERTDERMKLSAGALKAARKATDDAYRKLVKMVNALALVEGENAGYADFIHYVNTQITHYKREVIGQSTSTSTPPTENPPTENPPVENPPAPDEGGGNEQGSNTDQTPQ